MRTAKINRKTNETEISVELNLDQTGEIDIQTDSAFFTHMLEQFAKHGLFSLKVIAKGDTEIDDHHLVEDTGIVLGQAFKEALGERKQIVRYSSRRIVMDETLVEACIDLTTRPYLVYDLEPGREFIGQFDASLPTEFWKAFSDNCGLNLHISKIRGDNAHHIIEASYKAVAIALKDACSIDPRKDPNQVPSTKGIL